MPFFLITPLLPLLSNCVLSYCLINRVSFIPIRLATKTRLLYRSFEMEIAGSLAVAGSVAALVNNLYITIITIKQISDQMKSADAQLTSIVAQLSTIKAALAQIQDLMQTAQYNEQLQADLELALQATQLHVDFINTKISKFKFKTTTSTLKFSSKARMVFESDDMNACLTRLNHQATALNLLIAVLTSKSVTEQKAMLQRSNTRKVFKQIRADNADMLDDAASLSSVSVLRDQKSVRHAMARTISEPLTNDNPFKRFSFDPQLRNSKPYGRLFGRRSSDKGPTIQVISEVDAESTVDDAATLVPDAETESLGYEKPKLDLEMPHDNLTKPPRFSKMLALANTQRDVSNIVAHGQRLWNPSDATNDAPVLSRKQSAQMHRLITQYFDLSISSHTLDEYSRDNSEAVLLDWYRDVSTVLLVANVSSYHYDGMRQHRDLELFAKIANDYHLWLAKIVLFLDTTGLDPYSAHSMSEEVKQRFMQAGKVGASIDRIHVVVGESNEMSAGTIFAVCNESERLQENKWAGLTRSPTF